MYYTIVFKLYRYNLYTIYLYIHLGHNRIVILSSKKGSGRNHVVISRVKKGKSAQPQLMKSAIKIKS